MAGLVDIGLDLGKVVEEGTHTELVNQGGIYAKLAKLQFEQGEGLTVK